MRGWLIILFLMSLQFSLAILNVYSPFYTIYPGQRLDFDTGQFYVASGYNLSDEIAGTAGSFDNLNKTYPSNLTGTFEFGYLQIIEMAWASWRVLSVFLGSFGALYGLLKEFYVPELVAFAVQAIADVTIFYGFYQILLGRAGKSIE